MNTTARIGIEVTAHGAKQAAADLAVVDRSLQSLRTATRSGTSGGRGNFANHADDIREIAKACGLSEKSIRSMLSSLEQVRKAQALNDLRTSAGLTAEELAGLQASAKATQGEVQVLGQTTNAVRLQMLALGASLVFLAKNCIDASIEAERLNKAYTAMYDSASVANIQLYFVYETSKLLGLEFNNTAESAKELFIAGKDTALEKDLNSIFEAVATASAALSLSSKDVQSVFKDFSKMISKGELEADTLREQFGGLLPGAFQKAAKAMEMTTVELEKFMNNGKLTAEELLPKLAKVFMEDFGEAAIQAGQGLQGQLNRISTEWSRFKESLLDADAVAGALSKLAGLMKTLAANAQNIMNVVATAAQWAAWIAGIYAALASAQGKAVLSTRALTAAKRMMSSIVSVAWPMAIGIGITALYKLWDSMKAGERETKALAERFNATSDELQKLIDKGDKAAISVIEVAIRQQIDKIDGFKKKFKDEISKHEEKIFTNIIETQISTFGEALTGYTEDTKKLAAATRIYLQEMKEAGLEVEKASKAYDKFDTVLKSIAKTNPGHSGLVTLREWLAATSQAAEDARLAEEELNGLKEQQNALLISTDTLQKGVTLSENLNLRCPAFRRKWTPSKHNCRRTKIGLFLTR